MNIAFVIFGAFRGLEGFRTKSTLELPTRIVSMVFGMTFEGTGGGELFSAIWSRTSVGFFSGMDSGVDGEGIGIFTYFVA